MSRHIEFYTDGAFSSKSEMGGWAYVCIEDNKVLETASGYEPYSTNNRMELKSFLSALEAAKTFAGTDAVVTIYTDSAYVSNCLKDGWYKKWQENGWRTSDKQDVKNQELWCPIIALYVKLLNNLHLEIVKVKGHKDNQWNNYADLLAVKARKQLEE